MGTLFLPNTVALIRRAPHPEWGKQLIDDLLSERSERLLAEESGSHQFHPQSARSRHLTARTAARAHGEAHGRGLRESGHDLWDEAEKFLNEEFGY